MVSHRGDRREKAERESSYPAMASQLMRTFRRSEVVLHLVDSEEGMEHDHGDRRADEERS